MEGGLVLGLPTSTAGREGSAQHLGIYLSPASPIGTNLAPMPGDSNESVGPAVRSRSSKALYPTGCAGSEGSINTS